MGLAKRTIFGIYGMTPYNRSTGVPYGQIKVLGGASLEMSGGLEYLYGGAQTFPWGAEPQTIEGKITGTLKEVPDYLLELWLGATMSAETTSLIASGTVDTVTISNNLYGTGFATTNGTDNLISISVQTTTNVKNRTIILVATTETAANVYITSDIYGETLLTETMMIANSISIVTATGTTVTACGLIFHGGANISLTAGYSYKFRTEGPNSGTSRAVVGMSGMTFPKFGCILTTKKSNGDFVEFDCYNVQASGTPIMLEEHAWSINDFEAALLIDSAKDKVFDARFVKKSG